MPKGRTRHYPLTVIIEQDQDGYYVAAVPALKICYTQAKIFEQLHPRIKQAIEISLGEEQELAPMRFIAI